MTTQKTTLLPRTKSLRAGAALALTTALLLAVGATTSHAQTFTVLYNFGVPGGPGSPGGVFAQGHDGNLYGTTSSGGSYGHGTVYRITTGGAAKVLHNFNGARGYFPVGGLTLGSNGNFYGTTTPSQQYDCQDTGCGNVFKMTPAGKLTVMHDFDASDWSHYVSTPKAPPIEGVDGNLYGTAQGSGPWPAYHPGGIYKLTPTGEMTRLGIMAADAPLLQAQDGNFYATASVEDYYWEGTLVEITPTGQGLLTYHFDDSIGARPFGPLVQTTDGNLYGTASPIAYKLTPGGDFSLLHDFSAEIQIQGEPAGALVLATDNNLYGLASYNNYPNGYLGGIYRVSPGGTFSWLYHFDGPQPIGILFQHTNGLLYGETTGDGTYGAGTLFSFDVGLAPFIHLVPTSGRIGKHIDILGQGFTGTTSVSFNGISATFRVASDTYLETNVPDGALTGSVTVTTPTSTLISNTVFRVTPKILSLSPSSGGVGAPVVITGSGLTQAAEVRFAGGADAIDFTVDSDTQVTAIVPAGAQTGRIAIRTPGGIVTSPVTFTVTP